MFLGYVFAVLAALASGSGSILESLGVRRARAFGGTSMDLANLRRQPIYFLGICERRAHRGSRNDLMATVRQRTGAVLVASAAGALRETYELLADALGQPVSP